MKVKVTLTWAYGLKQQAPPFPFKKINAYNHPIVSVDLEKLVYSF